MKIPDRTKGHVVLLVIHTNTYFNNLLPIARILKKTALFEPLMFFVNSYPTIERDQNTCRNYNIKFSGAQVVVIPRSFISRVSRGLRARLFNILSFIRNSVCAAILELHFSRKRIRIIIREQNAALMVCPADNRYDFAVYIKAAHDEVIPAVVAPAFMAASREWAEAVRDNPDYNCVKWTNALIARLYPRWKYDHQGAALLAWPANQVLARELLGLAPPLPWTLHSGYADAIAIESDAIKAFCITEGIPEQQLVTTGSIDHDVLTRQLTHKSSLRRQICNKYGFDLSKKFILTALPPDQLAGRGRKECDFKDYSDLVRYWITTLVQVGNANVLVSLHPSVFKEDMSYIENRGVKIAAENISSLIPLCDIYVASISATIQWAIASGIPVINYDVYRYRYPDYLRVPGVLTMEEQNGFWESLRRIIHDQAYFAEMCSLQAASSSHWGVLDGQAEARLLSLFAALIERSNKGSLSSMRKSSE